ncbi:MAG: NADH-quinone oxidoreductase subunit H [Deltaproteobacteria bacterium]|nr:NADH-quinone oxidoreductase subunit H [Deltaproteobacteria bacterium]
MTAGWLLAGASAALVTAGALAWRWARASVAATLAACGAAAAAALWTLTGAGTWDWQPGLALGGQPIHLQLDPMSAFFLALLATVGGAGSWFARGYWSDRERGSSAARGRLWWAAFLLSVGWLLLTRNGLHFLLGWELLAITAYFLITLDRRDPEARAAGWLYLAASHTATLSLFLFFAALASRTGTWELGPVRDPAVAPLFWLALIGFGIKGAVWPGHVWLPSAHASAPSHVSALLSGVAIKIGMYGLFRFSEWLPLPAQAGWVVLGLGLASGVLGVAFALAQHDLKRLLAYHSVENIGIILIGLGFAILARQYGQPAWGNLVLAGGLLHVWNHGLFKSLLFLGAGSVHHATGTRIMSQLGGLWRSMPWTASFFALGAMAIAGLPPLNGFVSEILIYVGLFDAFASGHPAYAAVGSAVLLGLTGALALACFSKVVGVVFLGAPRTAAAAHAHEAGPEQRTAMAVLAGLCVIIGLLPAGAWPLVAMVAAQWQGQPVQNTPLLLTYLGSLHLALGCAGVAAAALLMARLRRVGVRRAPTWDCGYAAPQATMQYTAGSYAATMTGWFRWILRPQRHGEPVHGIFAQPTRVTEHTGETVMQLAVEPLARAVLLLGDLARRMQHGRVQAYVLYILVGVAFIAALALHGGAP